MSGLRGNHVAARPAADTSVAPNASSGTTRCIRLPRGLVRIGADQVSAKHCRPSSLSMSCSTVSSANGSISTVPTLKLAATPTCVCTGRRSGLPNATGDQARARRGHGSASRPADQLGGRGIRSLAGCQGSEGFECRGTVHKSGKDQDAGPFERPAPLFELLRLTAEGRTRGRREAEGRLAAQ